MALQKQYQYGRMAKWVLEGVGQGRHISRTGQSRRDNGWMDIRMHA